MKTKEMNRVAADLIKALGGHGVTVDHDQARWMVVRAWEYFRPYKTAEGATREVRRAVQYLAR